MSQAAAGGELPHELSQGPDVTDEEISVLLVDDDGQFAEIVADYLDREHGFETTIETDPATAYETLATDTTVDCLVSDYEMPDMDGLELLETVRAEFPSLPFVMFAGQGSESIASQAIRQGADDYLQKDTGEARYELLATRIENCVTVTRQRHRLHELYEAIEASGHSMVMTDRDGTITYVNPSTERVSGYDADELVGATPAILSSDEHDDEFYAEVWETITDGDVWHGDVVNERKTGEQYVIDQTISPITSVAGEITGYVAINREITDRKKRERKLRTFRQAVEHAGHTVLITDREGTIEYVNEAFEEMTGYNREEVLGETPTINKSGEHGEDFYADLWETILEGEVWEGELVNERKDGTHYVINQTIAPITDGDGDITNFVAINRDITDRKKRERDLTFLKRAVDQAGIGLRTYDATGELTYVNQRLAEIAGTDSAELEGTHVTEINPESDPDCFEDHWESFEDGDRRVYEGTVERIDTGEIVPTEIISSRVVIDGEPYQVGSVRDITDQKERERELRRFREAVEHAGHAVVITDTDGTIEYVNPAFEKITGYARPEVIGENPRLLKSGVHDQQFYEDLWGTILDGDVWRNEVVNHRKSGERYVIDQTIAPLTEDGKPTEFVAINNDITELKAYERELEAQNERLEQYGETVAHDLRNPLTLLEAELEHLRVIVQDELDEQPAKEPLETGCDNCHEIVGQMRTLIDDLLQMAKQGQLVLDARTVNLEAVAGAALAQIDAPAAEFVVDDTSLEADPDRLRELLSNLYRNAVEHGGDDVTVRTGPLSFSEGFYVEDDGPGIPATDHDRVLERGFTTDDDGTGFGLAIVTEIAQAHDWEVTVTTGSDGGARFEFGPEE